MNDRIKRLVDVALKEEIYPAPCTIELDPFDEKLAEPLRNAKRLTEYMLAQEIVLGDDNHLIGLMKFGGVPVPADIFPRAGHTKFDDLRIKYYRKPQENLCTFEWQHSNPDLGKVIRIGLYGYVDEINKSRKKFIGEMDHLDFLTGLEMTIQGIMLRVDQYRAFCVKKAETASPERKKELRHMADMLEQVPMHPARTFEEAVQCCYICWMFLSDSIGRPDQYLYPLFMKDMKSGLLTRERAKELLQEFYVAIHQHTAHATTQEDKGAESHFVVGGYTIDHECAWNELSELIVEALMDTPLVRPQVSLRWNKKTPYAVLRKMMDYERKDKNKRIAFVNDDPRIDSLMKIQKFAWEDAYDYIMVGCNEPAFQGGISLGGNTANLLRSMTAVLTERRTEVLECRTFDEFYSLWEKVLRRDLELILNYSNRFNMLRSRDCNTLSSIFLDGCIERAESATRGGARLARSGMHFMGGTNLIDSLSVIREFVFDKKQFTMQELLSALDTNWKDAEEMRQTILRNAHFFGNNDDLSNEMAHRVYTSFYDFAMGRLEHFGNQIGYGNLTGYNPHFAWFGELTGATPDGRKAGEPLTFGSGQVFGKQHEGATSHLLSVAKMDPTGIMCADTIMNLTVEAELIHNDESFEKLVRMVEAYFLAGGLHLQLNYVSREELLKAKANPDDYRSLRVRVSGFSAFFTKLNGHLQDNVIARTSEKIS